jgi:xanthine dehydrogenase accessory factor
MSLGLKVLIKGAGEMATGVAHRLHRANFKVTLTEAPNPLAVRRAVSFCEAVYDGRKVVEDVAAVLVSQPEDIQAVWQRGEIPLLVDPETKALGSLKPEVFLEATISKKNTGISKTDAPLVIALGPGFEAGVDAHVVLETNRGHNLGRLIRQGTAAPNTGVPGVMGGYSMERVLRAPADGVFETDCAIGQRVEKGEQVARVASQPVVAQVGGILRGLIRPGLKVWQGLKVGDVDPRGEVAFVHTISEKARALGGSVLEAIMSVYNQE